MSQLFLVNQKHKAWPVQSDYRANDSEPVLFSESKPYNKNSVAQPWFF